MSPQGRRKEPGWSRIDPTMGWNNWVGRREVQKASEVTLTVRQSAPTCNEGGSFDKGKGTQRLLLCVKSVRKLLSFLEFSLFYFPLTPLWGWTRPVGNLNEVRGKASQPGIARQLWCSSGDILAWSFVSSPSHSDLICSHFKISQIIQGHFYSAFSYGPNCSKRRILAGPQSTDIIIFMSQKPFRYVFLACLSSCTIPWKASWYEVDSKEKSPCCWHARAQSCY